MYELYDGTLCLFVGKYLKYNNSMCCTERISSVGLTRESSVAQAHPVSEHIIQHT